MLLGLFPGVKPRSYSVRACLASTPTKCKTLSCTHVACGPLDGLLPGAKYTLTATANLTSGSVVKASNTIPLTMPPAAAPVLTAAKPAGFTNGRANALPPFTGPCNSYFWVFTPVAGGKAVNATTTTLTIKTASLVPGGVYDTKVACVLPGRAAGPSRGLLQVSLGPYSNVRQFVMPMPNGPFLDFVTAGATTATINVQPPSGTGARRYHACMPLHCRCPTACC